MKHILIVEDDYDIAENLSELLELEGYSTKIARDGQDALGQARSLKPSLILLDLMMPIMDGFQFRSEQMRDPSLSSVPVIVMTAGGNIENRLDSLSVQAFFRKPLDLDQLLTKISELYA